LYDLCWSCECGFIKEGYLFLSVIINKMFRVIVSLSGPVLIDNNCLIALLEQASAEVLVFLKSP